jgi:superfamily II DNA or RNA helicase
MRPTKSLGLYLQQVGRGLRPAPNKSHLIVLDHAGNSIKHGLIEEPRAWSLEGRKKRQAVPAARQCPECYAVHTPAPTCPECGHSYASEPREREIEHVAGHLQEIDPVARMAAATQANARLNRWRDKPLKDVLREAKDADLEEVAKARGYKRGWAFHIRRQRQAARAGVAA